MAVLTASPLKKYFRIHTVFFALVFLLIPSLAWAQQFVQRNYGISDGLPSQVTYDIAVDSSGLLWIASEGGLCNFNGKEFVVNPVEGLSGSDVLKIDVMLDGSLLCLTLNGGVQNVKDGKNVNLMPEKESSNYQSIYALENSKGNFFVLVNKNYWYFSEKDPEKRKILAKGVLADSTSTGGAQVFSDSTFVLASQDFFIFINTQSVKYFKRNSIKRIAEYSIFCKNNKIYYNFSNELRKLDPVTGVDELVYSVPVQNKGNVILRFIALENEFWLITSSGIFRIDEFGNFIEKRILKGNTISGKVIRDWQGNFWITSITDGIFWMPAEPILNMQLIPDQSFQELTVDEKGNTYGFTKSAFFYKFDPNLNLINTKEASNLSFNTYYLESNPYKDELLFASISAISISKDLNRLEMLTERSNKAVSFDGKDRQIISFSGGAIIKDEKGGERISDIRSYSNLVIAPGKYLIGTVEGLYSYENGGKATRLLPDLNIDIRSIAKDEDGKIWLATHGDGLIIWNPSTNKIIQFNKDSGLPDDRCKSIKVSEKYAWLALAKTIVKFDIRSPHNFESYNAGIQLPVNQINDIELKNNELVIASDKGLLFLDQSISVPADSIKFNIKGFIVDGKERAFSDSLNLSADERNLKIVFHALDYANKSQIEFLYKMEGVDDDWVSTSTPVCQYSALPAGKYSFFLKAKSVSGKIEELNPVYIEVEKKFQERILYDAMLFLFGSFIVGALLWYLYGNYHKSLRIESKMNQARLTAIRARMNPHFVFNAINSIQDFVMNNDKLEANRFLVKFSRLMRMVLNSATKNVNTLGYVLETLELYLSLEKLRFEDRLEYFFEIDPSINTNEVLLPTMLLQPNVENALKHGLAHKKEKGNLFIRIRTEHDYLIMEVEDNGIGRKLAKKIKESHGNSEYQSQGSQLVRDQLRTINKITKKENTMEIVDLYDENKKPRGTKVVIKFYESIYRSMIKNT